MVKFLNTNTIQQKKKKTLIIISILGGILLLVGAFFLGRVSGEKKSPEPKNNPPSDNQGEKQEIQKLKAELNLVKNQLKQSNINQKKQLESKLSDIEDKIKILTSQDKKIIQELEKEIKEIKKKLEENKPDNPPSPSDRKEGKFDYVVLLKENNTNYHLFRNIFEGVNPQDWRVIYVEENHSEIKRLLREGKLQEKKQFTIRYGKPDKDEKLWIFFNENNRELEIREA